MGGKKIITQTMEITALNVEADQEETFTICEGQEIEIIYEDFTEEYYIQFVYNNGVYQIDCYTLEYR